MDKYNIQPYNYYNMDERLPDWPPSKSQKDIPKSLDEEAEAPRC
jgi:hypothetical protein